MYWGGRSVGCLLYRDSHLLTKSPRTRIHSFQSTQDVLARTAKRCPNCSTLTTHYHNHGCHHVKPGTGTIDRCSMVGRPIAYNLTPLNSPDPITQAAPPAATTGASSATTTAGSHGRFVPKVPIPPWLAPSFTPHKPKPTPFQPNQGCPNQCRLYCDANCGCPRCPDCLPGLPCAACDRDCDSCRLHA